MQKTALAATLLMLAAWTATPPSGAQEPTAPPATTLRREVNLVSIYFTVRDGKRRLIPNLPRENFRVFEDGREQDIRFFAHHTDVPLNLGVLLDTSTSLPRILGLEAEAATQFLRHVLRPADLAFVLSYDSRIHVLQVPTADLDLLEEKVQSIRRYARAQETAGPLPPSPPPSWPLPMPSPLPRPAPGPVPMPELRVARLYDALGLSVGKFLAEEIGRKAVVIVALADDAKSESSLEDALRALQQSDVIAYVLQLYHRGGDPCDVEHVFRRDRLRRLAEETGGRVLEVRGLDRLQAALAEIADELHNQYSLGYRPLNEQWDGGFRRIQIRVRGPGYRIYARKGYYATLRPSP